MECVLLCSPQSVGLPAKRRTCRSSAAQPVRLYEVGRSATSSAAGRCVHSDLGLSLPQTLDYAARLGSSWRRGKALISGIEFESATCTALAWRCRVAPIPPLRWSSPACLRPAFRGIEVKFGRRDRTCARLVDVISLAQASAEHCARWRPLPIQERHHRRRRLRSQRCDAASSCFSADGTLSRLVLTRGCLAASARRRRGLTVGARADAVSGEHGYSCHEILHLHGSGTARLTLRYVSEGAVFRPSYRLVLRRRCNAGKLQGFALITTTPMKPARLKLDLVTDARSRFVPLAAPATPAGRS